MSVLSRQESTLQNLVQSRVNVLSREVSTLERRILADLIVLYTQARSSPVHSGNEG